MKTYARAPVRGTGVGAGLDEPATLRARASRRMKLTCGVQRRDPRRRPAHPARMCYSDTHWQARLLALARAHVGCMSLQTTQEERTLAGPPSACV